MIRARLVPSVLRVLLGSILALSASSVLGQASRTWVSGVGDDANPCSRTAPCKTFAGAISKTAAGGEINAIDPGGYGTVTITKAITIDGGGTMASILASGTNAIVINAGSGDTVTLRNLSINGNGTGINGIRFLAGGALHVENVSIFRFAQKGISIETSTTARFWLRNSQISDNNTGGTGGGVFIKPALGASVLASIENTRLDRNLFGLRAEDRSVVTVSGSVAAANNNNGFHAVSATDPAVITLEDTVVSSHGSFGVLTNGGLARVQLSNTTVTGNGTGLAPSNGSIVSFGNNRILGNTTDGAPSLTVPQQ